MVADGNCGFRAVAHIIHGRESVWPEVRQHLLDHLNSVPAGYLRDVAIPSGAEMSLQRLQANLMLDPFGTVASGLTAISMLS